MCIRDSSCGYWFEKEPCEPTVKRMAPRNFDKDGHSCRIRQEKRATRWIALCASAPWLQLLQRRSITMLVSAHGRCGRSASVAHLSIGAFGLQFIIAGETKIILLRLRLRSARLILKQIIVGADAAVNAEVGGWTEQMFPGLFFPQSPEQFVDPAFQPQIAPDTPDAFELGQTPAIIPGQHKTVSAGRDFCVIPAITHDIARTIAGTGAM